MLKITDYNASSFTKGIPIGEAQDVCVSREINGAHTLEFTYPVNEKSNIIRENKIVICGGQAYRIMKVSTVRDGRELIRAECSHVWNADAPNVHLQNMPDMIGKQPTEIIRRAILGTRFSLFNDLELSALGLKRMDSDGFKIDFFSTDKTNPYDVARTVISLSGRGELYTDNYKIALVERIGHDTPVRLCLSKNMRDMTVERDITDTVTRLYPYGRDDVHIGSVNNGCQYIESSKSSIYGIREGFRDYSDIAEPAALLRRALWEIDSQNPERIDVPCVNITGTFVDLCKLSGYEGEEIGLGDGVTVIDGGEELYERVIKIEYYPYSAQSAVISVGRVKKDMFFYLEQIGTLARRYKGVSTRNGKVKASSVSGTIKNSAVISNRIQANEILLAGNVISADEEGNLLLNGEKIIGEKDDEQNI